jgi:hypothetical protein
MPISNSYPSGIPIADADLFVGTKAYNNRTVNYTAQGVADYLNINSKVAIGGQMSFQFTIVPNIPKTIAFEGGLGNNTAFSEITKLIVSAIDLSTANITIFLNYLNNSQVLLSEQNQPNFFGHYKITGYTQIGTSAFYELDLEFIGGNGTIIDKQYYDLVSFVLSTEAPPIEWGSITGDIEDQTDLIDYIASQVITPTLQQVLEEGDNATINGVGDLSIIYADGTLSTEIYQDKNVASITSSTDTDYISLIADTDTNIFLTKSLVSTDLKIRVEEPTGVAGEIIIKDPVSETETVAFLSDITTPTLQNVLDFNHALVSGRNYQGTTAGLGATGTNINALGSNAALYNSGDNINALGNTSGNNNSGNNVNAFGDSAGNGNTFNNVNLFGENATADEDGQTVLSKDGTIMARISTFELTDTRNYKLPDAEGTFALLSDIPAAGVTSVGLTMPSAFTISNSPITSSGDIAVTGAGLVSQYVRGDGTLANFPTSTGGGSSVNYYLNGSVSQGTFGGVAYYQMSKTPILGTGTNFTRTNGQGNGYIASFITDAGDPSFLNIPGGNWNLEFYFQSSASGGSPQFYGEIYKVSATNVFTLVASGSANPEGITNGTTVDQYFTSISVPQTSLLVTDRLAIRIYVITSGRTITLHTENGNLCEVLTTFTTGLTALNGLTDQVQFFDVGTGATNFNISSSGDTHTFNLLFNIRRNANNSSNNNINYNGYAVTGSAESSAVWTITRLTIAASGSITVATATNVAWTDRETTIYT